MREGFHCGQANGNNFIPRRLDSLIDSTLITVVGIWHHGLSAARASPKSRTEIKVVSQAKMSLGQ